MEQKIIREWNIEEIKELLLRNDRAVERAIVAIYNRQTSSEQSAKSTNQKNGIGFNSVDSLFLSSLAEQIMKGRKLTSKQLEIGRKKILKYSKQLMDISNNK